MSEVGRSLDEIDLKVKKLNSTLKVSTSQTKELDKALKLDSKNVKASQSKMKNLQTQIGLATQKVVLLKQKQLEANKAMQNGDISANEYAKIETAVIKATNELTTYNLELERTSAAQQKAKLENIEKGFGGVSKAVKASQTTLKAFSRVALGVITSCATAVVSFTKLTVALNDTAEAFGVTVEELQIQRHIFESVTGSADNYDQALGSVEQMMKSIALGTGVDYLKVLRRLGVSTKDETGNTKNLSTMYKDIILALKDVDNETRQTTYAYQIFGENALNVLEIMNLSTEQIQALTEEQINLGITSSDGASKAEEMQQSWASVKTKFMQVATQLAVTLLPIIQQLTTFVTKTLMPILTSIISWFANLTPRQQQMIAIILVVITILPKLVAIIGAVIAVIKGITIACFGAAGGVGAISAASVPLIPILWAVATVILVIVTLILIFTGRSGSLTKQLKDQQKVMDDMANSYSDVGSDFNVNSTQTSENSNTNAIEIHVDIDAYGETEMSQKNADLVAEKLAERINRELGGKI